MFHYDASGDQSIVELALKLAAVAQRRQESVQTTFREIQLTVTPGTGPESIVNDYWTKLSNRWNRQAFRRKDRDAFIAVCGTLLGFYMMLVFPFLAVWISGDRNNIHSWWAKGIFYTGLALTVVGFTGVIVQMVRSARGYYER